MEHKKIELEKLDLTFSEHEDRVEFIKVSCPSCSDEVSAENIDIESKIGKCTSCNALFSVKEEVDGLTKKTIEVEKIERPQGLESFHFRNELEIEIGQPFPVLDTIVYCIAPFILLFALLLYFVKDASGGLPVAIVSAIILAISIVRTFRQKQHRILFSINRDQIDVLYKPKNFNNNRQYRVSEIDQVYVGRGVDGAALFFIMNGEDGQRHEKVVDRIRNHIHLKYIEQEIEQYLAIENRKITGEV